MKEIQLDYIDYLKSSCPINMYDYAQNAPN